MPMKQERVSCDQGNRNKILQQDLTTTILYVSMKKTYETGQDNYVLSFQLGWMGYSV